MRIQVLIVGVSYVALSAAADVRVRQQDGRLSIEATSAPLSDVLDHLARQTGMQVVYEGAPPRSPVSLSLADRTPAEAVISVLDGSGLNYALRLDESGGRVLTLVMAGAAGAPAAAKPSSHDVSPETPLMPPPYPPPPSYPQEPPNEDDFGDPNGGVIPPPPPQPPQEFTIAPPQKPEPEVQPPPFNAPSLGSGFSSPFSSSGFSTPHIIGGRSTLDAAVPSPQPSDEPPRDQDQKEP